jgi:hypothetical protein
MVHWWNYGFDEIFQQDCDVFVRHKTEDIIIVSLLDDPQLLLNGSQFCQQHHA